MKMYVHPCRRLKKICQASFRETWQWLKFSLDGLRAQSRASPVVGLQPLASKQLYDCDSVVISSFVRTGYTTTMWGWLLGRESRVE
jgi:hypothetical protein